jgi:3-isopropylmalate dehydratase small subunit
MANALAVDGSGNVFVTGSSAGNYATIAYSGAGIPLWTNRYDSGPNEEATAVGVDNAGNVFVTGSSLSHDPPHYSTIAYSPAGVALWTNRHVNVTPGATNRGDRATALVVDHNGNVFVSGYLHPVSSNWFTLDYVTIAYSGAGVALWTNRYNGSADRSDIPASVAVDHNGNVIFTGGSFSNRATIAYSGTGVPLWTNRYGSLTYQPSAVAVDSFANIFVTGFDYTSVTGPDLMTFAYSSTGAALWTSVYNGQINRDDEATAVAVDQHSGTLFVTGSSSTRINLDYVTIAYSEAGVALWTNRYNGPGNARDTVSSVAVDTSGNVIVTGISEGEVSLDYATIAYSASGAALWTNRFDGPGPSYAGDYATAVAVGDSGNVFVTGYSPVSVSPSGFSYDYVTIAYSAAGVPLWTNRYNGPGNLSDNAWAVAADKTGNVFVTGDSTGSDLNVDYATVGFSLTGASLWTNRYDGPANGRDGARAVAVDQSGTVFVTGYSFGSGSDYDFATIAYSAAGVPLWTNRYNGAANTNDQANAVAVDNSGNVFVTGYSFGSGSHYDYATIAYSAAGVPLWTNRYNGTANTNDQANAVAVDNSGNILVTGYSIGNGSSFDFATVAYSPAGMRLWTNRYNGPANGPDRPGLSKCLAVGPKGEVYITGSSDGHYGNASISDYATIKYVWRPHLEIDRLTAGASTVNLSLSGPANSSWNIQRSSVVNGPWTNLGLSRIGTNGLGTFPDANAPANGAFYRAR